MGQGHVRRQIFDDVFDERVGRGYRAAATAGCSEEVQHLERWGVAAAPYMAGASYTIRRRRTRSARRFEGQ